MEARPIEDFRMGNLYYGDKNNVLVVEHWTFDCYRHDGLTPIPLTEEWLLKMGFKEVKPKAGVQKAFLYNGVRIELSNSGNFYYKGFPKNKVHLIQNLVHALTNTELTINL